MRKMRRAAALLFFLALVPSAALAHSATGSCAPSVGKGGILSGLANQVSTTTGSWTTTALGYAQDLFFALVAVEIAWSAITYVLQKDSLPDFLAALLLKIISVGFFYILLQPQYGPVWISDVIASFSQAGSAIGGQSQFGPSDPSSVFNCGTDIANAMLQSLSGNPVGLNFGNILPAVEATLAALVCALGVVWGRSGPPFPPPACAAGNLYRGRRRRADLWVRLVAYPQPRRLAHERRAPHDAWKFPRNRRRDCGRRRRARQRRRRDARRRAYTLNHRLQDAPRSRRDWAVERRP